MKKKNKQDVINYSHNERIDENYSIDSTVVIYTGRTEDFMTTLPEGGINLIITSPPYNVGKEYEVKTSIEKYFEQQEPIINTLCKLLADNGSLCWQVGNFVDKSEVFPLDMYYYYLFKNKGLKLRNRIIWHFGHGLHASKRFSGRYETLLWFTKSDNYTFNLDSVRVPSKYPGKRNWKSGDDYGKPSGNPMGKNPSDVWEFMHHEWETGIWDIPNCKANHPEKTIHPCQFPIELVERCVLAFTNKGEIVFDPFGGVGSTVVAALKQDRKGIMVDKENTYTEIAKERVKQLRNGTLNFRPIGTEVYKPTGKEKVSQVPEEWNDLPMIYTKK